MFFLIHISQKKSELKGLSYFGSALLLSVSISLLNLIPMELLINLKEDYSLSTVLLSWLDKNLQEAIWNVAFVGFEWSLLLLFPFCLFYQEDDEPKTLRQSSSRLWNSVVNTFLIFVLVAMSVFLIRALVGFPFSYKIIEISQFFAFEIVSIVAIYSLYLFPAGIISCFNFLATFPVPPNLNSTRAERLQELTLELCHIESEIDRNQELPMKRRKLTGDFKRKIELENEITELTAHLNNKMTPLIRNLAFTIALILVLFLLALFLLQLAFHSLQFFQVFRNMSLSPLLTYGFNSLVYMYYIFSLYSGIFSLSIMKSKSSDVVPLKCLFIMVLASSIPVMYTAISLTMISPKGLFSVFQFKFVVYWSDLVHSTQIWIPLLYRLGLFSCIVFAILNRVQSLLLTLLKSLLSSQ